MAVVEAAPGKVALTVDDVDQRPRFGFGVRLLDHLLEDPGMVGVAFGLELDQGQRARGVWVHPCMIAKGWSIRDVGRRAQQG